MKYTKIITHAGTHHADEILAIETIREFTAQEIPVERKYTATEEEMNDPSVLVLDIMRELNPVKGNMDHHQDGNIPATNILVLDYFCQDEELKGILKHYLFSYVDAVDRGEIIEGKDKPEFLTPSFNSIIRNLNNIENGFEIALTIARATLKAAIETAKKAIEGKKLWDKLEKIKGIAINDSDTYIPGWHELAENEEILLYITPNPRKEGSYSITTRSTDILKIPKDSRQNFLHANQFIAAYNCLEDAFDHAKEIIQSQEQSQE